MAAFVSGLVAVAAMLLIALMWNGQNRDLVLIGLVTGTAFAVQAVVKKLGRRMRMPAQIIGALGLTSCAPAAYYVVSGQLDFRAAGLWVASWLFAADQIHFVQMRIHGAKIVEIGNRLRHGRFFLAMQVVMVAAVLLSIRLELFPKVAAVAFLPVLVRGLLWFVETPKPLSVRRLGWTELMHGAIFGVLLTVTFRLG